MRNTSYILMSAFATGLVALTAMGSDDLLHMEGHPADDVILRQDSLGTDVVPPAPGLPEPRRASELPCAGLTAKDPLLDSLPATWEYEQQCFQTTPSRDPWWDTFNDCTLTCLIGRAVENNFDVLAAIHRIEAAAQVCNETRGGYFPTIGVSAGYSRERSAGAMEGKRVASSNIGYFQLGLTMSWEIDVFGKIRAQLKYDKAEYEATVAEYDATLVTLCSNVAKAYFSLRLAQMEINIANNTIKNAEELLHLAQTRFDVGLATFIDVLQARMVVTETRATLPSLEADVTTYINELSLLLGVYPDQLGFLEEPAELPCTPPPGYVGDPTMLIRRRPDVVEAEKELAAAAAEVGIAKKDFLPTLSITGGLGTEAFDLKDLFGKNSLYYSIAPTLTWTLFEGFTRKAKVAEAKANMLAEIDSYNMTVMTAVNEVNNAMATWKSTTDLEVYYCMLLKDARKLLDLQVDRYKQGLCEFDDVADAETTVLEYENSVAEAHANQLAALVGIYTALGGGY